MFSAKLVSTLGQVPFVGTALRWYARQYQEGSVVRIARGHAAGMLWQRHHRYVNGYWTGVYELTLQEVFARELKAGDVVYDIGANAGFFTLLAANLVGPAGRVFSFEPLPENIESVREQISINSLAHCELITSAVSNHCGEAAFSLTENNSTAHISKTNGENHTRRNHRLTVPTVTLDEFIRNHPRPDFIKLDVEGAETEVLVGATSLLSSSSAPKLLIELHGEDKARSIESTLTACGYELCDLSGEKLVAGAVGQHHILAYPPSIQAYN